MKTKETSAEKSAKRRQRGRKLLKEMDLPQRHRAHREIRGEPWVPDPTPPVVLYGFEKKGVVGKGIVRV